MRKQFTPNQKATVALAALSGTKTVSQIASAYEVHPTQITKWKDTAKTGLPGLFVDKRAKAAQTQQQLIDELHRVIGVRDAELEWLKKKSASFSP